MNEFIAPNWHPLLVHYPIALIVTGTLLELFSFLGWRGHAARVAGQWMILIGVLGSVVAVTSGLNALVDVARHGTPEADAFDSWHRMARNSPLVQTSAAWTVMSRHVWLESIATGVMLLATIVWIGCSDRWRRSVAPACMVLLLLGIGLMSTGAYFSGEGIYRHGVGVDTATTNPPAKTLEYFVPPMEGHTLGAGLTIALAAMTVALAIRARTVMGRPEGIDQIAAALGGTSIDLPPGSVVRESLPLATAQELSMRVPSSRFALLTALIALLTAAGGWWVLANTASMSVIAYRDLWPLIRDPNQNDGFVLTRRLSHVICGSAIIVLPVLIALVSRFIPRSRLILSLLIMLFVLAIAGQVWLGVALIFDGNAGPVTKFVAAGRS